MSSNPIPDAKRQKLRCAVVPLFIDRDRNPIQGLRYRIESSWARAIEGVSQLNGLGERFVTKEQGRNIRVLVRRLDGSWKLIYETKAEYGEKLITLKSGKICVPLTLEPHPQTAEGLPVGDSPAAGKLLPVAIGTPMQASGDLHHPLVHGAELGMKGQQVRTPEGATDTRFSKDRPDLQRYFALYTGERITPEDWDEAARRIECETEIIQAFAHVESREAAFDRHHRPTLLYERHIFAKYTGHRFDDTNADISGKRYTRRKFDETGHAIAANDRYGANQYERFERAFALDEAAAIQACSWGKFQVLGENYKDLRFPTAQAFLEAACTSEREHLLRIFVRFVLAKQDRKYGHGTLKEALVKKNWSNAAWLYNGPSYRENNYDNKLRLAYEKIKNGDLRV